MTNLNVLPFAKEARKTVGAYLLQELGFLRKGKTGKFFRAEKEIFLFVQSFLFLGFLFLFDG